MTEPDSFNELIENKYGSDYAENQREQDRVDYVKHLLFAKKRTFKNFIDNNSNLLRKETQNKKIMISGVMEDKERKLHDYN